ncbi:putative nuclease HARBI1 isoform X1 [Tanacetum coccineum]|uniref:Nuclease HARBI1 isoform X1 n=1 Tax=Tanacetum coccineum TaxID=301880 RepID=A0ABQ5AND3_9ASTR
MDVAGNETNNVDEIALISGRKKKPKSPPLWNNDTHMNIKARTGKDFTYKQLKNHWENMKKDWKLYDRLMRLEYGIGWDPIRKTIDASAEWWDEKIKANEDLAKFRGQNLEMYKLYYDPLFRDTVAVGDRSKLSLDCRLVDEDEEHQEGKGDSDDMNACDDEMDSNESDSYDEDEENWVEEENNFLLSCVIAVKGIIMGRKLKNKRKPCRTSSQMGYKFIKDILNGHERRCYEVFRPLDPLLDSESNSNIHVPVFKVLCADLVIGYGLKPPRHICIEESVVIFMITLAHGCGNRLLQETFSHSGETIHRHFYKVLKAVLRLSADIIKPNASYNEQVPPQILNNPRYYPFFKGTAHDTRIYNEALHRPEVKFPVPIGEKYYVVDAGYPNTRGYLAPYKGTDIRYHLRDFRRGRTAAILWKARWAILKYMHVDYPYETQVDIVIASMALHNYIRMKNNTDDAFHMAQQETYNPNQDFDTGGSINETTEDTSSSRRDRDNDLYMSAVRDMIADELLASSR